MTGNDDGHPGPLPFTDRAFASAPEYVDSLLSFVANNDHLRTFCGGVHILDFFTNDDDLYSRVIPPEWQDFFRGQGIMDILDLLMREDLVNIASNGRWRDATLLPPASLIEYAHAVRKHWLDRKPKASQCTRNRAVKPVQKLERQVAVGMKVKKIHEVGLFAHHISNLSDHIGEVTGKRVSHLVDFGSGQNYLGRALASEPYNSSIVAIESRAHNAQRAKELDVHAKLAPKTKLMRNKKAFKLDGIVQPEEVVPEKFNTLSLSNGDAPDIELPARGRGRVQYVEHSIQDGDLSSVVSAIPTPDPNLMVISLHSCGNLVHHGLRSLILNPAVGAVAMVGCCYNLLTERLGPSTYKLPELRPNSHPRLEKTGHAYDPHGFPMSSRFCNYRSDAATMNDDVANKNDIGVRFNITARMMAVQAPQNWGEEDSAKFFTRHFYRALLQRIFLDRGVVGKPEIEFVGGRPKSRAFAGRNGENDEQGAGGVRAQGTPIVIGSLRKGCYDDFVSYVRGALAKLIAPAEDANGYGNGECCEANPSVELSKLIKERMEGLTDEDIRGYETVFLPRKKDLAIVWSLMAFSATVVECAIVVDRWLWLREQEEVQDAWVEAVFDHRISPRNLVVVGIKK